MKDNSFLEAISKSLKISHLEESSATPPEIHRQERHPGKPEKGKSEEESASSPAESFSEINQPLATTPKRGTHRIMAVSLFENDVQAVAAIRERLQASNPSDTVNRSDALKVAVRYALGADASSLAEIYQEVKKEDGRLKTTVKKPAQL